jgi:hypothetical protein
LSTSVSSQNLNISRVAVLDDDQEQAEITSLCLEAAGFEPLIVKAAEPFTTHEQLTAVLTDSGVQAAICDHRLTLRRFSTFNGASHVAYEYDRGFPSILVTQYVDIDRDVSIREYRQKIPVLLSRDLADPENIIIGLQVTVDELNGKVPPERIPHRTIIRITEIGDEANQQVVDAIVTSWNPYRAVRFPLKLIPNELHSMVAPGARFVANVNIGTEKQEGLFFFGFEQAPEPNPEDGLG